MITLRRAEGRHHDRRGKQQAWLTFCPAHDGAQALADGFGTLRLLSEERLAGGSALPQRPLDDTEIVTYVREGALTFSEAPGQSGVIQAGEFRCTTSAARSSPGEMRASRGDPTEVLRLWLRLPRAGGAPSCEQKRFTAAQRRGRLCLVASPDGSGGSLRLHQDTWIYSAVLDVGDHVVHTRSRQGEAPRCTSCAAR
jgi:redox-sensitive bicupin YhaK (pirin superfamily)